jgi:hypothetical protein
MGKSYRSLKLLAVVLLYAVFVIACGPEPRPDVITLESSVQTTATTISPLPTPEAPSEGTPAPWLDNLATPVPVPFPDFSVKTGTILDEIRFANQRPLKFPETKSASSGLIAWSPDSSQFTILYGDVFSPHPLQVSGLYLGDSQTGETKFLIPQGVWSSWSADGRYIYYLATRLVDGETQMKPLTPGSARPYYDLYRYTLASSETDLLVEDATNPSLPQPLVQEIWTGDLILLNQNHQPVLVTHPETTIKNGPLEQENLPLLTELVGDTELSSLVSEAEGTFVNVAPTGDIAAVIPYCQPFAIVDLRSMAMLARIDEIPCYANNTAWSPKTHELAYASRRGLYLHGMTSGESHVLLTIEDLGFVWKDDDSTKGFSGPQWISNGEVLLITVYAIFDWYYSAERQHPGHLNHFVFAVTKDGAAFRAVSTLGLLSVSPNGKYGLVYDIDPQTGIETKSLVDILP